MSEHPIIEVPLRELGGSTLAHMVECLRTQLAERDAQLAAALGFIEKVAKRSVAVYEHSDGRKVFMGEKPTEVAVMAMEFLATRHPIQPKGDK